MNDSEGNESVANSPSGASLRLPVRPKKGAWPTTFLPSRFARFLFTDPAVITEPGCGVDDFQRAMFGIYVGGTIKITWANRHTEAHRMLLENVDLSGARIVDMGASDGMSSLDLVRSIEQPFTSFAITDQFLYLSWSQRRSHRYLWWGDECILVSGRRLIAWPHLSTAVGRTYQILIKAAFREPRSTVLLINPEVLREADEDSRINFREHDIFTVWDGEPVDVIKTANVLRRLYFSDDQLRLALGSIHRSLDRGGYLLLSDNSRRAGGPAASGLYRKTERSFERVVTSSHRAPDIDDLVTSEHQHR